jgi:hypothetical protein
MRGPRHPYRLGPTTREANLHLVAGNARFLICRHVHVPHLASPLLARITGPPGHRRGVHSHTPVLAETFVERDQFAGTNDKAANWVHVGHHQRRGKLDRYNKRELPVKDVNLFPLRRAYQKIPTTGT